LHGKPKNLLSQGKMAGFEIENFENGGYIFTANLSKI